MANREKFLSSFSSRNKTRKPQNTGEPRRDSKGAKKSDSRRRRARQAKEAIWEE